MKRKILALAIPAALAALPAAAQPAQVTAADNPMDVDPREYLDRLSLPEGFSISIYADGLDDARSLEVADDGTVFVGTRGDMGEQAVGKVYAILPDEDGDGRGDEVITIAEGLNFPNGVALHEGDLYVAELGRVLRYNDVMEHLRDLPEPEVIRDDFDDEFLHGWKHIDFGPDGKLYVPVGAPCNICEVEGKSGTIVRMDADGSNLETVARGVRNSVGFDWHPETEEMYFTDNGRDLWGNERPPEELNRVTEPGRHYGFPHRYGKDLVDEDFPSDLAADEFVPAAVEFPAHSAGLGIEFYTGEMFPDEYRNELFLASHGSWNRNPPRGYAIRRVHFEDDQPTGDFEDFVSGWLIDERYWGRPVDIEIAPDGALLVSDDHNDLVYRISYEE